MGARSEQILLDYLFESNQAEIIQRNGRDTNRLKIGDRNYQYVRGQPLTDRLKRKLKNVKQTMGYKKYELENKRGIRRKRRNKNKNNTTSKREMNQENPQKEQKRRKKQKDESLKKKQ